MDEAVDDTDDEMKPAALGGEVDATSRLCQLKHISDDTEQIRGDGTHIDP